MPPVGLELPNMPPDGLEPPNAPMEDWVDGEARVPKGLEAVDAPKLLEVFMPKGFAADGAKVFADWKAFVPCPTAELPPNMFPSQQQQVPTD